MIEVSTAEARERFAELINRAAYGGERIVLTRHGKAMAVLMPIESAHDGRVDASEQSVPPAFTIEHTIERLASLADLPLDSLRRTLQDICLRHHVVELSIFGSGTSERFSSASDLDLLVTFSNDAPIGFIELGRLEGELESLFHRKIDLIPKPGLRPMLREEVLATAQVLYAS